MAKFFPVFVACFQYAIGYYIFKKPDVNGGGPWMACFLVLCSLFLVLWSLPLYPRNLRRLDGLANWFAQYLISAFTVELFMASFWFPLEVTFLALIPYLGNTLEETLAAHDFRCSTPCDVLKEEFTGVVFSYLLGIAVLIGAMHASRVINLKLLFREGIGAFMADVKDRIEGTLKKFKSITAWMPSSCPKVDFVPDEDDYNSQSQDQDMPYNNNYGYYYRR